MCISSMCNIPGFLLTDFPFHVCNRWSDQQYPDQTWNLINRLQLPGKFHQCQDRDHPGSDLEMDRLQFYLAGLQNIEYSVYEAAKIDGANGWKTFWKITVPLLKPTIIMTFIMSINGTLQLFDESVNLTKGGPANSTITMSHYIYNTCFINVPNFGYASAMSFIIFIMVAVLAFINLKVGDTRD